jgi:hypothetical protein
VVVRLQGKEHLLGKIKYASPLHSNQAGLVFTHSLTKTALLSCSDLISLGDCINCLRIRSVPDWDNVVPPSD